MSPMHMREHRTAMSMIALFVAFAFGAAMIGILV